MARQQVIGGVEGNEALGVLSGKEDPRRVLDPHRLVDRGVEHEKGPVQLGNLVRQGLAANIVEKRFGNVERPARQCHLGAPVAFDVPDLGGEILNDVVGIGGRRDGRDRLDLGNASGRGQHRRSAEAVPDEERRRLVLGAQVIGGANQVLDI